MVRDRVKAANNSYSKLFQEATDKNSRFLHLALIAKAEEDTEIVDEIAYLNFAYKRALDNRTWDSWKLYVMALEEYQARYILKAPVNTVEEQLRACQVVNAKLAFDLSCPSNAAMQRLAFSTPRLGAALLDGQ